MNNATPTLLGQPDDAAALLRDAWAAASETERQAFLIEVRREYLSRPRAPSPTPKTQAGRRPHARIDGERALEGFR